MIAKRTAAILFSGQDGCSACPASIWCLSSAAQDYSTSSIVSFRSVLYEAIKHEHGRFESSDRHSRRANSQTAPIYQPHPIFIVGNRSSATHNLHNTEQGQERHQGLLSSALFRVVSSIRMFSANSSSQLNGELHSFFLRLGTGASHRDHLNQRNSAPNQA